MKSFILKTILITGALLLAIYCFVEPKTARNFIEQSDYRYLDGFVFSILGRPQGGEKHDRELYKAIRKDMDYSWIASFNPDFPWIAHALGGAVSEHANTKYAYQQSLAAGFKFFEVDLIYSNEKLLCAHDLHSIRNDICDFNWLLERARQDKIWFILDVKSDFSTAYNLIHKELGQTELGKHFIPQIYLFSQAAELDLAMVSAPLFTAYRRNTSLQYSIELAIEFSLPIMTVPPNIESLDIEPYKISMLTHGINDPQRIERLKQNGVSGFYIKSSSIDGLTDSD